MLPHSVLEYYSRKDGDNMKVLAGHHWSAEKILALIVIASLAVGSLIGLLAGSALGNIGVGVSLGALAGLIVGIVTGILISDREE